MNFNSYYLHTGLTEDKNSYQPLFAAVLKLGVATLCWVTKFQNKIFRAGKFCQEFFLKLKIFDFLSFIQIVGCEIIPEKRDY